MQSTKDRIDKILGIGGDTGKSIDDLFSDFDKDIQKVKDASGAIDDSLTEDFKKVDEKLGIVQADPSKSGLMITDIDASMKEIEELIVVAKKMFLHVYENFISSELIDSEVLHGASSFIEALHLNIQEFINIYRDKQKFIEKVKLMAYAQEQKKELMQFKHDLEMQKIKEKDKAEAVDVTGSAGGFSFKVEDVTKALDQIERRGQELEDVMEFPNV